MAGQNENSSSGTSNIDHVLRHLSDLSLQNARPKRTIKLAIFPDNYDKTIIPPLEQGELKKLITTAVYLCYKC